jgi:hypothetical protein
MANGSWLLPAVDDTGVVYLHAAPQIAAGAEATMPWTSWRSPSSAGPTSEYGAAFAVAMAGMMWVRPVAHVAGLWALALSAGLLLFAVAWVVGGVAGIPGALLAGLALLSSPVLVGLGMSLRPELLLMALVAFQLGLMTYKPTWGLGHGVMASLAWLTHPVGVGAVASAVLWAWWRPAVGRRWPGVALTLLPPVVLLAVGATGGGLLSPAALPALRAGLGDALPATFTGLLGWAGSGLPGVVGLVLGVVVTLGGVVTVLADMRETPPAPADVHWSDAAAPDQLAEGLRPAAAVLALGLLTPALVGAGGASGALGAARAAVLVPLVALFSAATTRRFRRQRRPATWLAVGVAALWLLASGFATRDAVRHTVANGRGLSEARWVSSEIVRWVDNRSSPFGTVYTTRPALLVLQSGRTSVTLPRDRSELPRFVALFAERPGALVVTPEPGDELGAADFADALGLVTVVEVPEGAVLVPAEAPTPAG